MEKYTKTKIALISVGVVMALMFLNFIISATVTDTPMDEVKDIIYGEWIDSNQNKTEFSSKNTYITKINEYAQNQYADLDAQYKGKDYEIKIRRNVDSYTMDFLEKKNGTTKYKENYTKKLGGK